MLLENFSFSWIRYYVLLFCEFVCLGCNHFGSYLFFQLFYLQPCSAKVAVPCPPAFTPGKFFSLFWSSIIFCGGVGFISRPCSYFDILPWFTHVTCDFIFRYFFQNLFIHRLFSASWAPSVCHLRRRGQPSWCWYSRVWYSFWICGISQDASWQDFSPVSRIILSSYSHNGLA